MVISKLVHELNAVSYTHLDCGAEVHAVIGFKNKDLVLSLIHISS